jgi:hypothetical protein
MKIKAKEITSDSERIIEGELTDLPPELIRFVRALARMAARHDYEYFCRTSAVLSYDGGVQE